MRQHLTFANVVSVIALFIALGGGAYALTRAPKNSVVSKSIKNGQVKKRDLAKNAVNGARVVDNSLSGADINESSLGQVPTALTASHADSADHADSASTADSATSATQAANAANASQLGGISPSGYVKYGSTIPSGTTVTGKFGSANSDTGNGVTQEEEVSLPLPAPIALDSAHVNFAPDPLAQDDDPTCTGSVDNPTAPAGKACLYSAYAWGGTNAGTAHGSQIFPGGGAYGFLVESQGSGVAGVAGTWAYTAP
jgi:hypothetical protein